MAFVGRAALWGLVCNGEDGVRAVLDILKREFDNTLAISGNNYIYLKWKQLHRFF